MENTRAQKSGQGEPQTFESLIDLQDALNACVIKYRGTSIAIRAIGQEEVPSGLQSLRHFDTAVIFLVCGFTKPVEEGMISIRTLTAGSSTQVSGSFHVLRGLYESWQKGSSPAMSGTYNDAQGNPVQSFI